MLPTIADCLRRSVELAPVSDSPRLDLEILLADTLQRDRAYLYTWPEQSLTAEQQATFTDALARRRAGEPVAHITGVREFWSLPLAVNSSTLIPRPDTELLVEAVLALSATDPSERPRRALDLGTGTGAIALALASEKPHWQIVGVDSETAAVTLARRNRERLHLPQVELILSHWFAALGGRRFDYILSNPPYIDAQDPYLHQGDLRFEPHSALVADDSGLADLALIVRQAVDHLSPGGWLLLEHGWQQGKAVRALCRQSGYSAIETLRDLAGRERVTRAQYTEVKP